jgi:hypothetical protein
MAVVVDNGNLSTLKVAPNAAIYYNRDGTITGKAFYTTKQSGGDADLAIGEAFPYGGGAYIAQYGYEYDEAGFINASAEYVGIWSSTVQTVDGIATTTQEPIVTHPGFVSNLGGTPDAPLNSAYFDPVSGQFIDFPAGSDLAGVIAYLNPGATVRVTFSTTSAGTVESAFENIGAVSDSITAGSVSFSYSYPAWLCTNVTYKEIPLGGAGSTFSVTTEYLFSQPNGWNSEIYPVNQYS